jgi:hypothetical protein
MRHSINHSSKPLSGSGHSEDEELLKCPACNGTDNQNWATGSFYFCNLCEGKGWITNERHRAWLLSLDIKIVAPITEEDIEKVKQIIAELKPKELQLLARIPNLKEMINGALKKEA